MGISLDYIAGLIDGDGSFSISVSKNRYVNKLGTSEPQFSFVVNLRQLDKYREILEGVRSVLGGGAIYDHSHKGNFLMLTWQTTKTEDTLRVSEKILPHLHIKTDACRIMIEACKLWLESPRKVGPNGGRPGVQPEVKSKILSLSAQMNICAQTETSRRNKEIRLPTFNDLPEVLENFMRAGEKS